MDMTEYTVSVTVNVEEEGVRKKDPETKTKKNM